MSFSLDRRRFLGTALAGAAIVAFDPLRGGWVTAAEAAEGAPAGAVSVPDLDGELTTDPAVLAAVADDFGHIVHRTPVAVLRPGSVRDVVALVRFADRHRIAVSMRGQGHSTDGQSQVHAGVVVDSTTLAQVHEIRSDRAVVDAGVTWLQLVTATLAHGLTPPVFTDYVELSVGGTISVGGIGGTTQTYGMQVDTVLELEVVTGEGELVRCSPSRHRALFEAVLGSLGQLAIVVRATVRLIPAPAAARGYQLFYTDLDTYLADQRRLLAGRRFSSLEGQATRNAADTGWDFFVDAAAYHDGTPPDDARITRGLRFDPARTVVTDYTYLEWVNRLKPTVDFLKSIGAWTLPHPWIDVFLPDSRTRAVVAATLDTLTLADTGQGPVLLYPFRPGLVGPRFVQRPREPVAFLFSLLRTTVPPADPLRQRADNRVLYDRARAVGGKRYPVGSVPLTPADWAASYGADYPALVAAKAEWDPRRVLSPGQGIFGPPR
ncbi:MAG TPA: FAD-binding protein [Mycobacteriales bacterium]|jgi:FAD/FMN-containing dehydrogenase|nr:FAD-binding protein [Mycobacteriales bacterium]